MTDSQPDPRPQPASPQDGPPPAAPPPGYQQGGYPQGGYQQPPYGQPGYQQGGRSQPLYGQPPYGQQPPYGPAPLNPSDERLWATLAHLAGIAGALLGFLTPLGPLVVYLIFKDRSAFVRDQAAEALNFQITVFIAVWISGLLIFVGIGLVLLPIVALGALILMILAAVAANHGEVYRYPLTWRLVR